MAERVGFELEQDPLDSVTYRNHVAAGAMNAVVAVAHCPPLPADTPLGQVRSPPEILNARSAGFLTKRVGMRTWAAPV